MPEKEPPKIKLPPKPEATPQAPVKKIEGKGIAAKIKEALKREQKDVHQEAILGDAMVKLKQEIDAGIVTPTSENINKLKAFAKKYNRPDVLPSMGGGQQAQPRVPIEPTEPAWVDYDSAKQRIDQDTAGFPRPHYVDAQGHARINPQDYVDPQGARHDLVELRRLLSDARDIGDSANPREYEALYHKLKRLPEETNGQVTIQDIEAYKSRIEDIRYKMSGDRPDLSAETLLKIERSADDRDEEFYVRLKKLLDSPEEESRHVMGLYERADMDNYLHAVGELKINDPNNSGRKIEIGKDLERLYKIRMEGLQNLHDVDYWARHPSGDIKSYTQTVAHIQNHQVKDALSDPYVEIMKSCYEKALLFIRSTHDGYIPPNLVTPDPIRGGRTEWDEQAFKTFKQKVETGQVFDVERDPHTGKPIQDTRAGYDGKTFTLKDNALTLEQFEKQKLRILATQQIARGLLVIDDRTLEIIGMSKVPGFDHAEFGIKEPAFSSKAYGQLARWFNPMAEWFGKYKMGVTLHRVLFQTLVEGRPTWTRWSSGQWRTAWESVMDGSLGSVFGDKAKRLIDMVNKFSFSGRFGPISLWGIKDATIGWTDRMKERLGGSIRLVMSESWAEGRMKDKFKASHPNMPESWYDTEWNKTKRGSAEKGWKGRTEKFKNTMRTWFWVQLTARHPTTVAGYLKEDVQIDGKTIKRPIRDRIVERILGVGDNGLGMDFNTFYKESNRTPGERQRAFLGKVAELEADVDTVQLKAMNMKDGKPRDIVETDFDIIADPIRRQRAKDYWRAVQQRVLGTWTATQWYEQLETDNRFRLGVSNDLDLKEENFDLHSVFSGAANAAGGDRPLLTEQLVSMEMLQHISLEDVQWRFLDIETLGPPHWNRRAGDLSARVEAIQALIKYLDMLTANPKREDLAKQLKEVFVAEKNHDPKWAHMMLWVFGVATGDLYRQEHWGKVPILGKIGPVIVPSSPAQKFFETTKAAAWSANNGRQWVDQFSDGAMMPLKEYYGDEYYGPYNAHEMAKQLGATRFAQIAELVIIGFGIATVVTALAAFTKQAEEESKH